MMKAEAHAVKRALIVKLGAIGDVIMAIPAVYALHQQGFGIDWVCGRTVQSLLGCYSWIHPIPVDDKAILSGGIGRRLSSIRSLWKRIGRMRYDLCLTLYYDPRYRFLALPVRAARKQMLSRSTRATRQIAGRHHADEYARFVLATEDTCRDTVYGPVRPDALPACPWPPPSAAKRIALVPGAGNQLVRAQASARLPEQTLRRWPVENYVKLAEWLVERGWEVVLIGGPEDVWIEPYFRQLPVTDQIGKLSLPEFISACDQCDAVITHDTGPLHLAGLSAACVVGIFGPTNPNMLIPRRPYSVGIWGGQGFACRPCYDGRDFAPCRFNGCMHQVSPELVLREMDKLLEARERQMTVPWAIVSPDIDATSVGASGLHSEMPPERRMQRI